MAFRPSEFPGGHERHCLRHINHAYLFANDVAASPILTNQSSAEVLMKAIARDETNAEVFAKEFEAILEQAVALKPSEETDVVLAVKAELDRLYTVSASLSGEQTEVREGLVRLIDLTMLSVQRAAGDDTLAAKELQQESDARSLHFKQLECSLLADLLNSNADGDAFIPANELIATLLSSEKAVLADVVGLFDSQQVSEIISQGERLLLRLEAKQQISEVVISQENNNLRIIANAQQNIEFIKGYKVYLEDYG